MHTFPLQHVKPPAAALPRQPVEGADWILRRAGLDPACYRRESLLRRIPACLRILKVHDMQEARQVLENQPQLLPVALSSLLIGVTEFFRDRAVFHRMRREIIPALAALNSPLRIWSAGCSNGAELYSMAMLLARAGLLERSYLLGTDCRSDALGHAREAAYHARVKGLTHDELNRWFSRDGDKFRLSGYFRSRAHWKRANWLRDVEKGPWDLILWRNAAIYLTPNAAAKIWARLHAQLRPGGFLITGKAERPPKSLEMKSIGRSIYRKTGV